MNIAGGQGSTHLARPAVRAVEPYVWEPASHEIARQYGIDESSVVRFDTNTAPLPPPCLPDVLRRVEADPRVNEYFESSYTSLAAALSDYTGYAPENLVIGAGADEILDIIAKTFLDPSDEVVIPLPTYAMYRIVSMTMAATVHAVPARSDLRYDVDSIVAAAKNAKLVFLCNPNNPTGLRLPIDDVARLVKSVNCMVAVDEAYAEFSGESVLSLIREQPRLIVIRTLSKAFSVAGARVGYAVTSPETAELANRVRPPNSISYVSVVLGEASVRDRDALRSNIATLVAEREWLSAELTGWGLDVIPSSTNFVLVRMPSPQSAARMYSACIRVGLVLRYYDTNPVLSTYLRITARSRAENERLLQTVRAALTIEGTPR